MNGGRGGRRNARWERGRERGRGRNENKDGLETRGRTQDGNCDWSRYGNEGSSGDGNRDTVGNVDGNEDDVGEGGGRRRSTRNYTRAVDVIKHFHSARAILSADSVYRLRASDSSARKA